MAKTIRTRIQLKYDEKSNWESKNPVLLAGEVAIATIAEVDTGDGIEETFTLMKVGDGSTRFEVLPWLSAPAADVYAWAKKANLVFGEEVITTTGEDDETYGGNAVTSIVWDADLNNGAGGIKYVKGTQFATQADLEAAIGAFGGDLDSIKDTDTKYEFEIVADTDATNKGKLKITTATYTNGTAGTTETQYIDLFTAEKLEELLPDLLPDIVIEDKQFTNQNNVAYVITNLEEDENNGHKIIPTYIAVPTKAYVDGKVAGAVDYLGTVSALTGLSTSAGKGDFYRVATAFGTAHPGDLLIAEKDEPAQLIDGTNWSLIHGEEGDITEVIAGYGLTDGGSVGSVTLNVGAGNGISVAADAVAVKGYNGITVDTNGVGVKAGNDGITVDSSGVKHAIPETVAPDIGVTNRTYINQITFDDYGHVTSIGTGTETVVDTNTWRSIKVNGTEMLGSAITTEAIDFVQGSNITLAYNAGKLTITGVGDTHHQAYNYVGAADTASNSATTNGNTYIKLYENGTKRSQFKIVGSGATAVSSDSSGNITISSTNTNYYHTPIHSEGVQIATGINVGDLYVPYATDEQNGIIQGWWSSADSNGGGYTLQSLKEGTVQGVKIHADFSSESGSYIRLGYDSSTQYGVGTISNTAYAMNTYETYDYELPLANGTFVMSTSDGYLSDGEILYFYCGTSTDLI